MTERSTKSSREVFAIGIAVIGIGAASALPSMAQEKFPSRPITLVVPFPPGGAGDVQARLIGQQLSEKLGQPVVIDNRAGAGTAIGAGFVANARPDGYTLLWSSNSTYTVNPAIRNNLPYDTLKSFDSLGIGGRTPLVLLANKDVPINNVKELIAATRAAPGKYSYGSYGAGTTAHFGGEILWRAIGAKVVHVPYKGSAPAMTDLIGGQIPLSMDTTTSAVPQLKGGKIKAIAVTSTKRASQLPDVPTFTEAGFPDVVMESWGMLAAPRGLKAEVRATLEHAFADVMADPKTKSGFLAQGVDPRYSTPAQAIAQIEHELPVMRAIAARANITID